MAIDSILGHIIEEAEAEKARIIDSANARAREILEKAELEAGHLFQEAMEHENASLARELKKRLVDARLDSRKEVLRAKQDLIGEVFRQLRSELPQDKIKKAQVRFDKTEEASADIDFYIEGLRREHETEVSHILFS